MNVDVIFSILFQFLIKNFLEQIYSDCGKKDEMSRFETKNWSQVAESSEEAISWFQNLLSKQRTCSLLFIWSNFLARKLKKTNRASHWQRTLWSSWLAFISNRISNEFVLWWKNYSPQNRGSWVCVPVENAGAFIYKTFLLSVSSRMPFKTSIHYYV